MMFNGWQIQPKDKAKKTVQGSIEAAFEILFKSQIKIMGSGRTDTGVHASGQVFHVELQTDDNRWVKKVNGLLQDHHIAITKVVAVPESFHARFTAISRSYIYTINQHPSPLNRHQELFFSAPIDIHYLQQLANIILNQSDFTSFCKLKDESETKICKITECSWEQVGSRLYFKIKANRFLYGMVRALVGTQLEFMKDAKTVEEFRDLFLKKDRTVSGASAKSWGLNLVKVIYPIEYGL